MATNEDFLMEKLKISLASMEAEAKKCCEIAKEMFDKAKYETAATMFMRADVYRECISMIKEDLGLE